MTNQSWACAVSGRHGSVASCASLADDSSLLQPDMGTTTLSRQASEALSSSLDSPEAVANTLSDIPEVQSSKAMSSSLRYNRAASWGPQSTPQLNAVSKESICHQQSNSKAKSRLHAQMT